MAEQIITSNRKEYYVEAGVDLNTNVSKVGIYRCFFIGEEKHNLFFIFDGNNIIHLNTPWFHDSIAITVSGGNIVLRYDNNSTLICLAYIG